MPTIRERNGRFQCQVRIKQGGQIVFQDSDTFPTYASAKAWGTALERRVKDEGAAGVKSGRMTVKTLLEKYEKARAATKPVGPGFTHSIHATANSELGALSVSKITPGDISKWAMERHKSGNKPATVMHYLATLSAAFNAAGPLFDVDANVKAVTTAIARLRMLRTIAPSERRERRATDAELDVLERELLAREGPIPVSVIMRLAVALPRRREELLTMRWEDLSADGKTIKLWDTKNPRKLRHEVIPVPPAALAIIKSLPRLDSRILPYKPESVSSAFQRAAKRAGLCDLRLHDLRHEGISRLFERGLSIEEVALISGHTSWATLRRYTHLRPESVTEKLT